MIDLINRYDVYAEIQKSFNKDAIGYADGQDLMDRVKQIPTAVVRCGECKFSDWYESVDGEQLCYCMEHGSTRHKETDYCNYGEREVQDGK